MIENGIKRPIRLLLENDCQAAALILTYSGMEMMAFLNMPRAKQDVTRSDFIDWSDKYMAPHLPQKLTGKDLYGARCGVLHGTDSRLAREGHTKLIRYRSTNEDASVVPVDLLVHSFFAGIDAFLAETSRNAAKTALIRERVEKMLKTLPF